VPRLSAIVVAAVLLVASGCGSGSDESSGTPPSTAETSETSTDSSSGETYTNDNWALVVSDPDEYKGESADLIGKVFSIEHDADAVALQVWADSDNSEQNTIVGYKDPNFQVADQDYVHVKGTIEGKYEGENLFGAKVTVPVVKATSLEIVDAIVAAPPATKTLPRNRASGEGVTVTVSKVEFAASETRAFVTVKNATDADLSFYASSAKAVSGTKAVGSKFSTREYPELQSDLPAGSDTSGVIVFPRMDPDVPLRLIFEGYSEDTEIGKYGAVKYELGWDASGSPA